MIKIRWTSKEYLEEYGTKLGMYKYRTRNGKVIDKAIYLDYENAGIKVLLHEFIHYLTHILKIPESILYLLDIPMHPKWKWWEERRFLRWSKS